MRPTSRVRSIGFTLVELFTVSKRGFTLVELLVVIAIIVILLALLVGGLEKALKAAERSKCGAGQRNIVQSAMIYATAFANTLPPRGGSPDSAMDLRDDTTVTNPLPPTWDAQVSAVARGLGRMVVTG